MAKAKWIKDRETGELTFDPYGGAKRVRMIFLDGDKVVEKCGVANLPEAIKATFNELCRLHVRDGFSIENVSYKLEKM